MTSLVDYFRVIGNIFLKYLTHLLILWYHLALLNNYVPSVSYFIKSSFLLLSQRDSSMRVYDRQLSLSPDVGHEHESSCRLLSPPFFHEKCDNIQDDQKACAEDEKFFNTSVRSVPRLNKGTRKTTNQYKKTLSARAIGNGTSGAADCSSQRLDALTYFELPSSTAIESNPDLALCFTPESVRKAAAALWKEMQSSSEFRTYAANKEKPREGKKKKLIWPHKLEFIFCQGK